MCVYPHVDKEMVTAILQDEEKIRFSAYTIEIDSKILHPSLAITPSEFVAMLLHEIGHIVNDTAPVDEVRKAQQEAIAKQAKKDCSVLYYLIIWYQGYCT